jgi:hypothetical protein
MSLDDSTLNNGTDTGHPYMLMGPDSITGVHNGFLNIVPDLGSVAARFGMAFKQDNANTALPGGYDDIGNVSTANGTYTINSVALDPLDTSVGIVDSNTLLVDETLNNFNFTFAGYSGNLGGHYQDGANGADGMNTFTVGGFKGMTMGMVSGALGNSFDTDTNSQTYGYPIADTTLANIPAGFKKAILDTWYGLKNNPDMADYLTDNNLDSADDLTGEHMLTFGFQSLYNSNLNNNTEADDSAFDYMKSATFKTFDAFANAGSKYNYIMPDDSDLDLAARIRKTTPDGTNYSFAASYNYDKNPIINLSWKGSSGQTLTLRETYHDVTPGTGGGAGVSESTCTTLSVNNACHTTLQLYDASNTSATSAIATAVDKTVNATLTNGFYGGQAQDLAYKDAFNAYITNYASNPSNPSSAEVQQAQGAGYTAAQDHRAYLQFDQEVKRVFQLGGAFDTVVETEEFGPVVIRGEALYTKDGYSPVMNKDRLAIGDLVGALQMKKADRFKFVLGVDITALTNMMISAQFIQDSNLDFVDNGNEYTTDYATMHLSNGFNKAIKDKNFYSLFLSKPFGESGQHRWNNILMLEEGGGKWNRFDIEYTIDDNTVGSVEYNKYWGDRNTQFGQLENSSNLQVGLKYTF